MTIHRNELVHFLHQFLEADQVEDPYCANGLQVQGKEQIKKVIFGVSASLEFFRKAEAAGADMMVVHHGIFWGKTFTQLTREKYLRVKFLMDHDLNLVNYHLPLDRHKAVGNNAELCRKLGFELVDYFDEYGWLGKSDDMKLSEIVKKLEKICPAGKDRMLVYDFGSNIVRNAVIISGGSVSHFDAAVASGVDLFIAGEGAEWAREMARESGMNFIAAGHYATETFGVQALMKVVEKQFPTLQCEFIDLPNEF